MQARLRQLAELRPVTTATENFYMVDAADYKLLLIQATAAQGLEKKNKKYKEALAYIMTAKPTHYHNRKNMLSDFKAVIEMTIGEEAADE